MGQPGNIHNIGTVFEFDLFKPDRVSAPFSQACKFGHQIDEVQAIQLKCVNLFNLAMNFISSICGVAVVLCTATQPCFDKAKYPIEFDEKMEMNSDFKEDLIHFHRTELISACRVKKYTYEEAADFCAEKYEESGNILIVVNTKKSAASIYVLLREKYQNANAEIIYLSTGMCPQHRRETIKISSKNLKKRNLLFA